MTETDFQPDPEAAAADMHVLMAPAANFITPTDGSEGGWMRELMLGLTRTSPELRITALADHVQDLGVPAISTFELGRFNFDLLDSALRPLRIVACARRVAPSAPPVSVLVHALPFAAGQTFSLLPWLGSMREVPFVVGPVQPLQQWVGGDEDLRSVGQRKGGYDHLAVLDRLLRSAYPSVDGFVARLSARTLRAANRVVAISEAGRELAVISGADPERVVVIPPPIDWTARFGRSEPSEGSFRIIVAGHLIARKCIDIVIAAVAAQPPGGPPIELEIIGDGPERDRLEQAAREVEGPHTVRFTGRVAREDLLRRFQSASLVASMSRSESWGGVIIEAMTAGVPVVSAANLGARSQHELGAPIELVPIGSREELARTIAELARDHERARHLGYRAAEWVSETLSADAVARKWLDVLSESVQEGALRRDWPSQRRVRKATT